MYKVQVRWIYCKKFICQRRLSNAVVANSPKISVASDHKGLFSLVLHIHCRSAGPLHHVIFILQLSRKEQSLPGTCQAKEKRRVCSREAHRPSVHLSFLKASHLTAPEIRKMGSRKGYYKSHGHTWHQCGGRYNFPTERGRDILNINTIYHIVSTKFAPGISELAA